MFGPDRPKELLDVDGFPLPPRKPAPDFAAIARYEQQMQDAFDAAAEHSDCSCGTEVNPFCKTHSG